jgi:chorismate synthase
MLRYWTAGESHGPALIALVDGFPAGLAVDKPAIDHELMRRQGGYGRGGRQRIETDTVTFLSGLWKGVTLGSPLALEVINKDAKLERLEEVERPRPGHADLPGSIKHLGGVRAVLERASARETAARVAAGALARQLLSAFGIEVAGWVTELGPVVLGDRGGQSGFRLGEVAYVETQQVGLAAGVFDFAHDQGGLLDPGAAMHGDVEAVPGEPERDGLADAAAGAGDEDATGLHRGRLAVM